MSDLPSKTKEIGSIGKQELPTKPKHNWGETLGSLGLRVYENTLQSGVNEYLTQVEEIKSFHLGEDETFKRLNALSAENRYLSMLSQTVKAQQKSLARMQDPKIRDLMRSSAVDRMKESLSVDALLDKYRNSTTIESFLKDSKQLKKDTESILKTGSSPEFNTKFDAIEDFGKIYLPKLNDVKLGSANIHELEKRWVNSLTNNFIAKVQESGRKSPNIEEFTQHINAVNSQIEAIGGNISIVRENAIEILKNNGDLNLARAALVKHPEFFTQDDVKNLPLAIKNRTEILDSNPIPLTEIDKQIKANNRIGLGSFIESDLITYDSDRRVKDFLEDKVVNMLSPEAINNLISSNNEYAANSHILFDIQKAFYDDFDESPGAALKARRIVREEGWGVLQGISKDEKGNPIIDLSLFRPSLDRLVKDVLFYKNSVYGGSDAINNVFEKEDKDVLRAILGNQNYQDKWNTSRTILNSINEANRNLAPGEKPINAIKNLTQLIQDDELLINMLGMSEGMSKEALSTYAILKTAETRDRESLGKLRMIGLGAASSILGTNLVDPSILGVAGDYLAGEYFRKHGNFDAQDRNIAGDKITTLSELGSPRVIIPKAIKKDLLNTLKNQYFKFEGKNRRLYDILLTGKLELVNVDYNLNKFNLRQFRDNIDSMANIGEYYIDPETKRRYEITIPSKG